MRCLWHRKKAGHLPQHRDPLEVQTQVEYLTKYSTQLGGTGFNHPGKNTVGTCSFAEWSLISCLLTWSGMQNTGVLTVWGEVRSSGCGEHDAEQGGGVE